MTVLRTFLLLLVFCSISCASKKEVVKKTSPEKVVIDSLIITKVPDQVPPPHQPPSPIQEKGEQTEVDSVYIPAPTQPPKLVNATNTSFHQKWDLVLKQYVTDQGNVDYSGIRNSSDFDIYIDWLVHNKPKNTSSDVEQLVFWINAYNALTIDLILRNYPVKSIKDIKDPWDQRLWKFGDKWLNLNDIEHKILREMGEPRIHFAIVCASESCPKLQNEAFTASNLEELLNKSTKEFLKDNSKNEITENSLKLSKIFKWFAKDFKQNGSLIDFLNRYTDINISEGARKSYKDYNWNLND